jgi:hypothetical protein
MKTQDCPKEDAEQRETVKWLRARKIPCCAIGNSQSLSFLNHRLAARIMGKLKALGLAPGFPDLIVFLPNQLLCIEMKRQKGGVVSDKQYYWQKVINKFSYAESVICRGYKEAVACVEERL